MAASIQQDGRGRFLRTWSLRRFKRQPHALRRLPHYGSVKNVDKILCWFCGAAIEATDTYAVMISIQSLWRWKMGSKGDDHPLQQIWAHSGCAAERMRGATMDLDVSIFHESE